MRDGLRLIEERDVREAAKLKALQEAARVGFADLDAGRYLEVDANALECVIRDLGRQENERMDGVRP
jgi:antitoxin ParD1/3/4